MITTRSFRRSVPPPALMLAVTALLAAPCLAVDPMVSNVRARQLVDGTRRVEVLYDLTGAPAGGATVSVAFSATGGAPYSIAPAAAALSGHVGAGIANGADRRILWDCALTLPAETYGTTYRAAVTAADPGGGPPITVTLPGGVPLVMVPIPAGSFTMGSPDGERGRYTGEGPQHQVTITQPFYLGRTEVTQAQWQAVMGTAMPTDCGSYGTGADYPVYCVSWNDICGGTTGSSGTPASFIGKLNAQQSSTKFRLPTEAEWEYAARAGTAGPFSFDTSANPNWDTWCGSFPQADPYMWWCGNNTPYGAKPVGQKLANPWGLFDMHGNLWEWVSDWYGSYSSSAQFDPQGPGSGSYRVIRGGSWYNYAHSCRSAYRDLNWPGNRYGGAGFRLARSQ